MPPAGIVAVVALVLLIYGVLKHVSLLYGPDGLSYLAVLAVIVLSMAVILLGCEVFANAVENIGERVGLSHATAGSLLAAIGTALPETLVPVFALVFGTKAHGEAIAVGAILGSPFMISTLAMFLVGATTIVLWIKKARDRPVFNVNTRAFQMDMYYFIPIMVFVLIISMLQNAAARYVGAFVLLGTYAVFFKTALSHEAAQGEQYVERLYANCYFGCSKSLTIIVVQIVSGLMFIVAGTCLFIEYITVFSIKTGISALVLSLVIAPVATELPEKFNSIAWTIRGKDTLAMANLTGAMVYQSTIPVSIGLLFTGWTLGHTELLNIMIAITMAAVLLITIKIKKTLPGWALLIGGIFYAAYMVRIFS